MSANLGVGTVGLVAAFPGMSFEHFITFAFGLGGTLALVIGALLIQTLVRYVRRPR